MANKKWYLQVNKGVCDIEILLPEFSQSNMVHIKPDIVMLLAQLGLPGYDLIIGVKTMSKIGIKLEV